jgi:hypothetical protein
LKFDVSMILLLVSVPNELGGARTGGRARVHSSRNIRFLLLFDASKLTPSRHLQSASAVSSEEFPPNFIQFSRTKL